MGALITSQLLKDPHAASVYLKDVVGIYLKDALITSQLVKDPHVASVYLKGSLLVSSLRTRM